MPAHTGIFGRVTVRITLTPNGDIANVELLTGAKDRTLSDEVVFAARATTYPFPPPKSIPVDRIFLVTYIYE